MSAAVSFEPLTPTSFLERSGKVYADRIAVIDGATRYTYAEFLDRCMRLSGALHKMGAIEGARVAVLAPNTHVLLESHYGVPLAGAVLVALNVRLTPDDLAFIVSHSGAAILIYDRDYEAVARPSRSASIAGCASCARGVATISTSISSQAPSRIGRHSRTSVE